MDGLSNRTSYPLQTSDGGSTGSTSAAAQGPGVAIDQPRLDAWRDSLPAPLTQALADARMRLIVDDRHPSLSLGGVFGPRVHFDGPKRTIAVSATAWEWDDFLSGGLQGRCMETPWLVPPLHVALGRAVHLARTPAHWEHPRRGATRADLEDESREAGWHIGQALLGRSSRSEGHQSMLARHDWSGERGLTPSPGVACPAARPLEDWEIGRVHLLRRPVGGATIDRNLCPAGVLPGGRDDADEVPVWIGGMDDGAAAPTADRSRTQGAPARAALPTPAAPSALSAPGADAVAAAAAAPQRSGPASLLTRLSRRIRRNKADPRSPQQSSRKP